MALGFSTTQIDNHKCVVTRWDFKPGDETNVHIYGHDYCVGPLLDGVLKIVSADGEEILAEMKAGQSYFRNEGVHHNVINANDFDCGFVEVEFK